MTNTVVFHKEDKGVLYWKKTPKFTISREKFSNIFFLTFSNIFFFSKNKMFKIFHRSKFFLGVYPRVGFKINFTIGVYECI